MDDEDLLKYSVIPENVIFSIFSTEDILKLSVKEIKTSLTFDVLGHPLPGGLYDPVLGPLNSKSDPCGTCGKNVYKCPGHFGHIRLPVPTLNPLFFQQLAAILKLSCFSCFNIQVQNNIKHILIIQMKLLLGGLLTEAKELESLVNVLLEDKEDKDNEGESISTSEISLSMYENLAETAIKHLKQNDARLFFTKNTESLRNQFISNVTDAIGKRKKCLHCKGTLGKLETTHRKIVVQNEEKIQRALMPDELRQLLHSIWANNKEFLSEIIPVMKMLSLKYPTDIFFFEIIPVPPPVVRPVNFAGSKLIEHPQTIVYQKILDCVLVLRSVIHVIKEENDISKLPEDVLPLYEKTFGSTAVEKMNNMWGELQDCVNGLISNTLTKRIKLPPGLKQILEKKQGIIRQNMMGKRVNFAARSVITPDPYLNIDEIGVPEAFAKKLTYPIGVTSYNAPMLKEMILNGPDIHPGAVAVELEDGVFKRIPNNRTARESIAKQLLLQESTNKNRSKGVKTVHRHLINGDSLLLNRQPTLHKPSIMAHSARILKGEKTLRLHYANCKAYNADFDGDEMNAHFPQNEVARSEAKNIVNVCKQYLVPKDGTPLSGLIQDHVISGVRLSIRGTLFNAMDYHHLVFSALAHQNRKIELLPPTVLKPERLWTGKQVISTVIRNTVPRITRDDGGEDEYVNIISKAKIGAKEWSRYKSRDWLAGGTPFRDQSTMSEAEVIIRKGELLCGVLDKQQYGSTQYCLIHCVYELHGAEVACKLLSSFSKLFTVYLQRDAFTLGVVDILNEPRADKKRRKLINESRKIGNEVIAKTLGFDDEVSETELHKKMEEMYATDVKYRAQVDRQYKMSLEKYTSSINKLCIPDGLICKFPENNLQLMVTSGAKGSIVNCMQISCLLGQIELEGKRPPLTVSGRSLPSFPPFDTSPRAGGFIDGRFMTGIQPQEFFFHCMAGREGLIDTAVKTSRSGYLQRCLIKHLEGLTVKYDLTVRDSDNSVIQFYYGEDGMDVLRSQFLSEKHLQFLKDNSSVIMNNNIHDKLKEMTDKKDKKLLKRHLSALQRWKSNYNSSMKHERRSMFTDFCIKSKRVINEEITSPNKKSKKSSRFKLSEKMVKIWRKMPEDEKSQFSLELNRCPDPAMSIFRPDRCLGVFSENLQETISNYCEKIDDKSERKRFQNMMDVKAISSLCEPGEPVGILAAQSIGEPSTQMTLNTFHFAGRGEMNVTLGIPRLREIFNAAKSIKTPCMEIPFSEELVGQEKQCEALRKRFCRVTLADLLEKITVNSELQLHPQQQNYKIKFHFLPHEIYKAEYYVTRKHILRFFEKSCINNIFTALVKASKEDSSSITIKEDKKKRSTKKDSEDGEGDKAPCALEPGESSDEELEGAEEDAKLQHKMADKDFDEPDRDEAVSDEDDHAFDERDDSREEKNEVENDEEGEAVVSKSIINCGRKSNFTYDGKELRWCELHFVLPNSFKQIDMTGILKNIAQKSVLWEVRGIKRAITYKNNENGRLMLRTDGINMHELFKYIAQFDLNKLYSNDVHSVAKTYGIEAARRVLVKEIQDVFKVYGIVVNPRHLMLVVDYMVYDGTVQPLTRTGMKNNVSPFQQMSFESTMTFLKNATLHGKTDYISSPSSCLMVGQPCRCGTGSFAIKQDLSAYIKKENIN